MHAYQRFNWYIFYMHVQVNSMHSFLVIAISSRGFLVKLNR
jgi:hypothetical protein